MAFFKGSENYRFAVSGVNHLALPCSNFQRHRRCIRRSVPSNLRYGCIVLPMFFYCCILARSDRTSPSGIEYAYCTYVIETITYALHKCSVFSQRELTFTFAICYRPSVCRLSVICNARAPYSGGSNFRQYFYGIRYFGNTLTFTENFTEIVPGEPLRRGS